MKKKIILLLTLLTNLFVFSQSQFQNVGTSTAGNSERVSNFSEARQREANKRYYYKG